MKKLLVLLTLWLITGAAFAQSITWGISGRAGAFTTLERAQQEIMEDDVDNGYGLQAAVGLWVAKPVSNSGTFQFALLQTIERQRSGRIALKDIDGTPAADLEVIDLNFAINGSAIYLYQLNNVWSVGAGAGALYEYFSQARVSLKASQNMNVKFSEKTQNFYRRDIRLYVPLEAQYKLTDRIALLGQLQAQISNRVAATESSFKERDIGLWLGVKYTFW